MKSSLSRKRPAAAGRRKVGRVSGEANLLREVRSLYLARQPLNISAVKRNRPELMEAAFAQSQAEFLGWKQGLEKAGIEYDKINVELTEYVRCEICGRELRTVGSHLRKVHEVTAEDYLEEFPWAETCSEEQRANKRNQMTRKRLRMPHWEPIWTPEYILDRAYAYYEAGYKMNAASIIRIDVSILNFARSFPELGGWDGVLTRIGLDPREVRLHKWAYEDGHAVIGAILERKQWALPLNHGTVARSDYALVDRAKALFGSWDEALAQAGLDPEYIRKCRAPRFDDETTARDEVKEAIQSRQEEGKSLRSTHLQKGPEADERLFRAAQEHFGSWYEALSEAGIDPRTVAHVPKVRYPEAGDVIVEILNRNIRGKPLNSTRVQKGKEADFPLFRAAKRWFGNWDEALKAAGVDPESTRAKSRSRFPDGNAVVAGIWQRQAQGLPLRSTAVTKGADRDWALFEAAKKHFGSWDDALLEAGIEPESVLVIVKRGYTTKDRVVEQIQERFCRGLPLNADAVSRGGKQAQADARLYEAGRKFFGSWPDALLAAGIDPSGIVRTPSS